MPQLPDDPWRQFNLSSAVVYRLWKKQFPLISYEPLQEDSDDLWGGDLSEDVWGEIGQSAVQKEVHAYISDRTFLARRIGFEAIRDVIAVIPVTLLDEKEINPKRGDKLSWNDMTFSVCELLPFGTYRNTNKYLYTAMNCRVL